MDYVISTKLEKSKDFLSMANLWNMYYEVLSTSRKTFTLESLRESYNSRKKIFHEFYGLFIDGNLNGFLICDESYLSKGLIKLKMMAISPEYQGNGYASKLLNFVLEKYKGKNVRITQLSAEVVEGNDDTRKKLVAHGFSIVRFDPKLKEYVLEKKLEV